MSGERKRQATAAMTMAAMGAMALAVGAPSGKYVAIMLFVFAWMAGLGVIWGYED